MYVDNVLLGVDNVTEAMNVYREGKELFNAASMNLRSWALISAEIMEQIPKEDQCKSGVQKCLGLLWGTSADTLSIKPINASQQIHVGNTKRGILQVLSWFYDPLGSHSLLVVRAKAILQQIWKEGFDWMNQFLSIGW